MMATSYGQKRKHPYTVERRLRRALAELEGRVGQRSDGRRHDTGLMRPYRPVPDDFEAAFIEMGYDGIDERFNTNWRVIRRWVLICGKARLTRLRAAYVEEQRRARRECGRRSARC